MQLFYLANFPKDREREEKRGEGERKRERRREKRERRRERIFGQSGALQVSLGRENFAYFHRDF